MTVTTQHRIALLEKYAFTIGDRDERLNTDHPGSHMVVEATAEEVSDPVLPTKDGANGPWCIVGDDLDGLVEEAHSYLLGMADDHNGIDAEWKRIQALDVDALPARRFTSLGSPAPKAI